MLEYGVRARKGVILLLGDAGTGKTTLLRKSLALRLAENRLNQHQLRQFKQRITLRCQLSPFSRQETAP